MELMSLDVILNSIRPVGTLGLDTEGYIKHEAYDPQLGAYVAFERDRMGSLIPLGRTLAQTPADACNVFLSYPPTQEQVITNKLEKFTLRSSEYLLEQWVIIIPDKLLIGWR